MKFTLEMSSGAMRQTSQGRLMLGLLSAVSLLMSLTAQRWLPERFLRDSSLVNERVFGSVSGYTDTFSIVAELYDFLAIFLNSNFLAFFQWSICIVPLLLISKIAIQPYSDFKTRIIAGVYILLIPFYVSSYSKEIIVILGVNFVLLFFWKFKNEKYRVIIFAFTLIILSALRPYYILTLFLTLVFVGILWRINWKWLPVALVISATTIFTFESITKLIDSISKVNILNLRFEVQNRTPVQVNSSIYAEIYGSSFLKNLFINIKVLKSIIFPFEFNEISLYIIGATAITWILIYALLTQTWTYRWEFLSTRLLRSFLFCYLLVALIFEPDVGSFNRHSFAWLPLVILLASTRKIKNQER
jgi:hypothetical protein